MVNEKIRKLQRVLNPRVAYVASVMFFLWLVAAFYMPGKGLTAFVMFGEKESGRYLPELKAMDVYIEPGSHGYDGQQYAQIAMRPKLGDPELAGAVDNISYRARRILFSWTAWVLGGGDPERALHAFVLQNVACWLALGALLLRWFPANSWENYLRWAGVMFSYGMWFSVRGALVDGPSLLLIAAGVALAEQGRSVWAALVLGISGLAKETNLLAGGVLLDFRDRSLRGWLTMAGRGVLLVLPLAVWGVYLWSLFGVSGGAGARNFALPFAGYLEKWRTVLAELSGEVPHPRAFTTGLWMVTVTAQFLFIALRPRWSELWWRVGAAFAVLMIFLGDAVWEGHPGAAARVLLPMALAFNILVPRGWRWLAILLLGNLTIFGLGHYSSLPGYPSFKVSGANELRVEAGGKRRVEAVYGAGWYASRRSRGEYWRWSSGDAELSLTNPHARALIADVNFGLRSKLPRQVTLWGGASGEERLWTGTVADDLVEVELRDVRLPPGETRWRFETDEPAQAPDSPGARPVAFSVRNLEMILRAWAE